MQSQSTEALQSLEERTREELRRRKVPSETEEEVLLLLDTPEEFKAFLEWLGTNTEANAEEMWDQASQIADPIIMATTRILTPEESARQEAERQAYAQQCRRCGCDIPEFGALLY